MFHPYLVYMGGGGLSSLLRGPKSGSIGTYLGCVLLPSTIYSLPHFLEHDVRERQDGRLVVVTVGD